MASNPPHAPLIGGAPLASPDMLADVPLPFFIKNIPPPKLPMPEAQVTKPTPLLKPSEKGIEQAKKMLRAFSIQRKQTATQASMKPTTPGQPKTAVQLGKADTASMKKSKLEKTKIQGNQQTKSTLPFNAAPTHPSYMPLQAQTFVEIEEMKRKIEIAELGIPLSLIQPGDQAMPNKAWPSKAMPPTHLLNKLRVGKFVERRRRYRWNTPDQVNELIMKARKAKEEGKILKFNYKEYFPDYENPFQQGRKRIESTSPVRDEDHRSRNKSTRNKYSRWNDDEKSSSSRDRDRRERESSSKDKDRETDVDLNDYVVCDSWSLETEDKGDDATPKSEAKSIKSNDESIVTKPNEVIKLIDIPIPKEDLKIKQDVKSKEITKMPDIQSGDVLKPVEYDPKKLLRDVIMRNALAAKEKLRPVVDEFIYDLDDDSSDNSVIDITPSKKSIRKGKETKLDPKVIIKQEVIDVNSETSSEKTAKEPIHHEIKEIPLPLMTQKEEKNSKSHSTNQKDSKPDKSDKDRKSPRSTSRESSDRHDKHEKSSISKSSKSEEIIYLRTPERFRDVTKKENDAENEIEVQEEKIETTEIISNEPVKIPSSLVSDCEPLTPDYNEDYSNVDIDEEKYPSPNIISPKNEPGYQGQEGLSKDMEECLDTWNFVLKICQPLLFRHDRNKCYRETKIQPSLWYTENPKVCQCVKDRGIIYEELDTLKTNLIDHLYESDQILEDTEQTCRDWYPREQYCISEEAAIPTEWDNDKLEPTSPLKKTVDPVPPPKTKSPIDDHFTATIDDTLDREYEKFMEAVIDDRKRISPKIKKSVGHKKSKEIKSDFADKPKKNAMDTKKFEITNKPIEKEQHTQKHELPITESNKVKEVTSELGTSMDESIMSADDIDVRLEKKKDKNEKVKKKAAKASSEYWSQESDAQEISKSEDKKAEKLEKQKKKKKKERVKRPKSSSSESDTSDDDSSDEISEKRAKDKKKKTSKASKLKQSRKRRLERKRRLKKAKRLNKIRKLKEKVQKSLEDDEDVGEFIKKAQEREKQKKKEIKTKEKKKLTQQKKLKKEESKKKKTRVSSSSSSSSMSSSSSSSSDSEEERQRRKRKKKQKEAVAKTEKIKKKSKSKKKRKSTEMSDSYSENEEEFDMNILNNIKMEQMSDEEITKAHTEEFSPRRPSTKNKEIVNASELHSDFVGRSIKKEHIDYEEQAIQQIHVNELEKENEKAIRQEEQLQLQAQDVKNKIESELKKPEVPSPIEIGINDDKISKPADNSISQDSSSSGGFKDPSQSAEPPKAKATPEGSIASPTSQDSASSFQRKPYEKDDSFLRSTENSNFSFGDVISSENHPETREAIEQKQTQPNESPDIPMPDESKNTEYKEPGVDIFHTNYEYENESKEHFSYYNSAEYADHHLQYPIEQPKPSPTPAEYDYGAEMEARPIETVVSANVNRGEIKCDWRPPTEIVKVAPVKMSRWGMEKKPGDANIVLTSSADDVYPIRSVLDHNEVSEQQQYKIETISTVRGSRQEQDETDYDGAYADMYGESDRLQYGDCFASERPAETTTQRTRLSLDDRIGLVLQQSILGEMAKNDSPPEPPTTEPGILINRLSAVSGREYRRDLKADRPNKRVTFADGYNPGQDSDAEEPPAKKRKVRRRYGCAWPCASNHPDHVPLWDALPPPPPPPGSPPPPPAPLPPPTHLLRRRKRRSEFPRPPHAPFVKKELQDIRLPSGEPPVKITRLPKVLSHPLS